MTGIAVICMILWAVIRMLWYYYVGEGRGLNKRLKELGEIYEAQGKSRSQIQQNLENFDKFPSSNPIKPRLGNTPPVIAEDEMYFFNSQDDEIINW